MAPLNLLSIIISILCFCYLKLNRKNHNCNRMKETRRAFIGNKTILKTTSWTPEGCPLFASLCIGIIVMKLFKWVHKVFSFSFETRPSPCQSHGCSLPGWSPARQSHRPSSQFSINTYNLYTLCLSFAVNSVFWFKTISCQWQVVTGQRFILDLIHIKK